MLNSFISKNLKMSLLSYFLYKTKVPEKFESATKYTKINGEKLIGVNLNDLAECKSFELGHKIYKQENFVIYETFFSNGQKIVLNHLSKHNKQGNLIELATYFGDNDKFDTTLDVCYMVDLINETLYSHDLNNNFWDQVVINEDETLNTTVSDFTSGFLISKNQTYNPKKMQTNGKIILELLGDDLEICYLDYLKYENMNILMYCTKYDIEQEINNNFNKTASDLSKRKIVGNCIMTSNENLDDSTMARVIVSALNFNQKAYEDRQKKDLLQLYARAYVMQHPKKEKLENQV